MAKYRSVSSSVTRRLPRYYRLLEDLKKKGVERISSREFAELIGFTASQIRQDLNCFGGFGQQGYGYNVAALHGEIGRILCADHSTPAILLGAGNLGVALARNMEFEKCGFRLLAVFDANPAIIGKKVHNWTVRDISELEQFCAEHHPQVAILCIPDEHAASMSERLVNCNIRGFWNFTHYDLRRKYGNSINVESVNLGDCLLMLNYNLNELMNSQ